MIVKKEKTADIINKLFYWSSKNILGLQPFWEEQLRNSFSTDIITSLINKVYWVF